MIYYTNIIAHQPWSVLPMFFVLLGVMVGVTLPLASADVGDADPIGFRVVRQDESGSWYTYWLEPDWITRNVNDGKQVGAIDFPAIL
ncbi:MAG: hypothetical protein OXD50_14030 [Chloroflexi bacterium]|nr:hypothetical protein [Chloroflexota bacterium]